MRWGDPTECGGHTCWRCYARDVRVSIERKYHKYRENGNILIEHYGEYGDLYLPLRCGEKYCGVGQGRGGISHSSSLSCRPASEGGGKGERNMENEGNSAETLRSLHHHSQKY